VTGDRIAPFGAMVRQGVRFAPDSPLEGTGFEPSVPLQKILPICATSERRPPSERHHMVCVLNPYYLIFYPDPACHGGYQPQVNRTMNFGGFHSRDIYFSTGKREDCLWPT
jgi:hypothetical protein